MDTKIVKIKPTTSYNEVNRGAKGMKTTNVTKLPFRVMSVLFMPLNKKANTALPNPE